MSPEVAQRLAPGSRVFVNHDGWAQHDRATVVRWSFTEYGAGGEGRMGAVGIRFDGYDYRLSASPDNCHWAHPSVLAPMPPPPPVGDPVALAEWLLA